MRKYCEHVAPMSLTKGSYLALDVYSAERGLTQAFKDTGGFFDFYANRAAARVVAPLFKKVLGTFGFEKFTAGIIGLEAELVREEAEHDSCIPTRVSDVCSEGARQTYALEMLARAWSRSRSMNMSIK
jgi:hypothetical protein